MVRFVDSEGESAADNGDGLAPVTSLFGDRSGRAVAKTAADVRQELDERIPARHGPSGSRPAPATFPSDAPQAEGWGTEWNDHGDTPRQDAGPIDFAAGRADRDRRGAGRTADRAGRTTDPGRTTDRGRAADRGGTAGRAGRTAGRAGRAGRTAEPAGLDDAAELGLLKKLRARQLSVSEAKAYLGQHELDADSVETILGAFLERGYLDDARLAEQVVHAGVDRKGQGRQAISQSLAKRGVPRDVADAALAELPDDDAERALEFARSKAGSMRGLERDVALRRLAGQLARRGYGGSAALGAARQALDEAMRPSGRVRFE